MGLRDLRAALFVDIRICMTLNLNKIGLLTRDESSDYPYDEVRELFGKYQIEVVLIEEGDHA